MDEAGSKRGEGPVRQVGVGGVGLILRTALGLYRRRAGPLLLVAAIFLLPNALLGVLERRASEGPGPTSPPSPEVVDAGPPAAGAAAEAKPPAPRPPTIEAAPPGAAPAAEPGPSADEVLPNLSAHEAFVRTVWLFIGSLFTSMLAAAVAREAAVAVTGREPAPLHSAGFGFAHVLGLGFLAVLAAAWSLFLLLFAAPAFMLLSLLQGTVPSGVVSGIALGLAFPIALVFAGLASLGIPVFVLEGRRGMGAILRVWVLVRGEVRHTAATVAALLLLGLAASGLALGLSAATGASVVPALAAGIVGAPFEALIAFFLYLDLRARKERLTLATLEGDLARNAP